MSSDGNIPLDRNPLFDAGYKVLLLGDSGVGKTCLLMRFTSDRYDDKMNSTIGVDFAIKNMLLQEKPLKLTIWDTAGQERFRTLTSTFYRGAHGVIFVYDVTRRDTLFNIREVWMKELETYGNCPDTVKMVVANKVDQAGLRQVSWQDGNAFAQHYGCLFIETSAKQNMAVGLAFEELVLRMVDNRVSRELATEAPTAAIVDVSKIDESWKSSTCGC